VIDRLKETGRKGFRLFLKIVAAFFIYFFGVITGPENWSVRNFVEKIAHDPKWTIPVFSFIAIMILVAAFVFIVKTFFKE
jgi:hypothetical protein